MVVGLNAVTFFCLWHLKHFYVTGETLFQEREKALRTVHVYSVAKVKAHLHCSECKNIQFFNRNF